MQSVAAVSVERRETQIMALNEFFMVEGVLLQIERIQVQGEPVIRYTVGGNGEPYRFLGTYEINQKIHAGDIGRWVRVSCEGEEQPAIVSGTEYASDAVESTT